MSGFRKKGEVTFSCAPSVALRGATLSRPRVGEGAYPVNYNLVKIGIFIRQPEHSTKESPDIFLLQSSCFSFVVVT